LVRRVYEHREGLADGFTKRYGIKTLVYFEAHETIAAALNAKRTSSIGRASGR
jgi:putative endonuclease